MDQQHMSGGQLHGQQMAGTGQQQQQQQQGLPMMYYPPQQQQQQQGVGQQQQQQFQQQQQAYLLQGKPMMMTNGGATMVALPGGTYIQSHPMMGGHQMMSGGLMDPSGGANANGGYPQLVGLPAGYTMAPMQPHMAGVHGGGGLPMLVSHAAPGGGNAGGGAAGVPTSLQHLNTGGFMGGPPLAVAIKQEEDRPSSSHSANTSAGGLGSDGSPHVGGSAGTPGSAGGNKSRYRGVSYDRKKAKWRVQIKVAALGKSGVSVGYFDTEEAAARAYDRAAIGLLGRDNPNLQTNFELADYAEEPIPRLTGKTREEVKTTLKSERIKQAPRRRFTSRQRTSRFMGVGSSNRKNQWQARILVHGKVTHLGYYETEEDAARVYDRVSLALHGDHAQTNFAVGEYTEEEVAPYRGLDRENLQRALGVKPMDKSSRFRGVSKKKGKWEAKVMVNRRWAYRELFDSEEEAARAYDRALWRLKPREARSYVNFKDEIPADAEALAAAAPGGDYRGVVSDGDLIDSDGGGGRFGGGGGGDGDDDEFSDGGDFEYEYRPTKGTTRSASMRAKRAGSAPNLAAAAAAAAAATVPGNANTMNRAVGAHQQAVQVKAEQSHAASIGPSFVSLPGGGLQLCLDNMGGGSGTTNNHVGNHQQYSQFEEPLLIRVGSETHVLPHSGPSPAHQILGKRTGLQRIQSEPQFHRQASGDYNAAAAAAIAAAGGNIGGGGASNITGLGADGNGAHHHDMLSHMHGTGGISGGNGVGENAGSIDDIHDLMNDKDLFKGLDLAELAGTSGLGGAPGSSSGGGLDLNSFALDFMHTEGERGGMGDGEGGGHGGHGGLAGLLFEEDEELALANLEFRPRKIPKSMSMTHLSELAGEGEEALPPMPITGSGGVGVVGSGIAAAPDLRGRPPLPPKHSSPPPPPPLGNAAAAELGPLGQPIRRTNTFTSSLPSFEEGAETHNHTGGDLALGGNGGGGGGAAVGHGDDDDLMKHFLANDTVLDDAMRMLGE
jgi:AP2 domain